MSSEAQRDPRGRAPKPDLVPKEDRTALRTIARSWTGGPLPLGLDQPLLMRGGSSLFPDELPIGLPFDWCPDLLDVIADECRDRLKDGRNWFGLPALALISNDTFFPRHVSTMIAVASGVPLVQLHLKGAVEELGLRSEQHTPMVTLPSRLVLHMAASRCANPVVLVEGCDATSGEALTALTSMMDPRTADRWIEDAIGATVDLSHVTWLVAINDRTTLPRPIERLLKPIRLDHDLDTVSNDLVLIGIVQEVVARIGASPAAAAAAWGQLHSEHSRAYGQGWQAVRERVEAVLYAHRY